MKLEPPNDVDVLCLALDIGLKRRARLSDEMGEAFIPWLQEMWLWAKAQDTDNYLHINPGFAKDDYADNPAKAARLPDGSREWTPPSDEIGTYRASRDARDAYQAEQMAEVGGLMAACQELRAAIDAMPAKRKQSMSRTLWMLKGRLDHFEREIRRRAAA